ncbi:WbqC family protein [Marinilongibacter aquaticus]|uniref:WbqC family protein n=1 Tax=Marinilongibacter aquaticus TaxID=2975157 RepID=UPI0021BDC6FC|nr:WbqC family protein [Marinilongibacter aquaticus]UBM59408.1 WbqC family protein [Marinilongibacter aquaticus]
MIFNLNFLPPIGFFAKMLQNEPVFLNESDVYFKQTYRNRAQILGANKVENLIIPVHASSGKTHIREVKIDNHSAWQRTQLRTIEAAYRNSPFYQYYDYLFLPLFQKQYNFLVDIQLLSLDICLKAMQIEKSIDWKTPLPTDEILDLSPKKINHLHSGIVYRQQFGDEFVPNLSVVDLIFNLGPESKEVLIKEM